MRRGPDRAPIRGALPILLGVLGLFAGPPPAGSGAPVGLATARAEEPPAPRVELDRLLKLPESLDYRVERRGGSTRSEWQLAFRSARAEIEKAKAAIAASQAGLEEVASEASAWQMALPGASANASEAPLDYRLRQDLRRERAELERADKHLADLTIEANLAGVPDEWRQ